MVGIRYIIFSMRLSGVRFGGQNRAFSRATRRYSLEMS